MSNFAKMCYNVKFRKKCVIMSIDKIGKMSIDKIGKMNRGLK
jgi:hypothetical protein